MIYTLMSKNTPVLDLEIHEETASILKIVEIHNKKHLPVGVRISEKKPDISSLNKWWQGRSIPASRSGIRDALEIMQVPYTEQLLLKCFGLSLSDQYWINPKSNPMEWNKVNFFENTFSDDVGNVLFGQEVQREDLDMMSPDNTSDGWLKKKWKIIDGKRCLIKAGSNPFNQEPLNEVIASAVQRRLKKEPYTSYALVWENNYPYSVCENFINTDTELVSAWNICQTEKKPNHVSPYNHYLSCCEHLGMGITDIKESIDYMLVVDFIIANSDRHYSNFGAVRDVNTLEWIGAAPLFDCGTSMWHDQLVQNIKPHKDVPSKPFKSYHSEQIKLAGSLEWIDFSALHGIDEECKEILKTSTYIDTARCDALCYGIRKRVEILQSLAMKQSVINVNGKIHQEMDLKMQFAFNIKLKYIIKVAPLC